MDVLLDAKIVIEGSISEAQLNELCLLIAKEVKGELGDTFPDGKAGAISEEGVRSYVEKHSTLAITLPSAVHGFNLPLENFLKRNQIKFRAWNQGGGSFDAQLRVFDGKIVKAYPINQEGWLLYNVYLATDLKEDSPYNELVKMRCLPPEITALFIR